MNLVALGHHLLYCRTQVIRLSSWQGDSFKFHCVYLESVLGRQLVANFSGDLEKDVPES